MAELTANGIRQYLQTNKGVAIGIPGVVLVVIGTFYDPGSLIRKILFLVSAPFLTVSAYVAGQKMLFLLQLVVTLSAVLAFFPVGLSIRVGTLLVPAVLIFIYLAVDGYIEEDPYWPIAGIGLILLATAFALGGLSPFYVTLFLTLGPGLIATYSLIEYITLDIPVQFIWFVLNVAIAAGPTVQLIGML
ncbi:hypothetical protein EXE41_12850 [Halorubrum sp. SD690R]|uniref:hypothetical protein n=1 Tax=Halorubrum sp. SD690R TaxID=2518117 RepID=UPI0010F8B46A|nr:hypothetical protein [Halorubrum sp. SD690R]TKX44859.1 hypothetical protein EXE41_12850 [Halorubrum sp. SD690R]